MINNQSASNCNPISNISNLNLDSCRPPSISVINIGDRMVNALRQYCWPINNEKSVDKEMMTKRKKHKLFKNLKNLKKQSKIKNNTPNKRQSKRTIESNRVQPSSIQIDSSKSKQQQQPPQQMLDLSQKNPNQMLITSDSYAILCDINCHYWIITLISWSFIYPRLTLPTNHYFQFASVHDVSNLGNQQSSYGCLRLFCCCCCLCFCPNCFHHHQRKQREQREQQQQQLSSSKNYYGRKFYDQSMIQPPSMTTIQINQRQNFQPINIVNHHQQPLSVINSPTNECTEVIIATETPVQHPPSLINSDCCDQQPMKQDDFLVSKDYDDCQTEITPDCSDVTSNVTYYPSTFNNDDDLPNHDNENQ
ncbi:hypothetical protein HUG17_0162 [Dermatophagoides farinae]|uniref:Uncharacterized protein n=1 Tax=Dermatophagoides farinae TaxID=6954 RepID=A0A9D4P5G2_DERFA|nr:hypothetical protein HUG17_0162 [Dermatophagoides farinae]